MHRKWLSLTIVFLLILALAVPLAAVADDDNNDEDPGYVRHPVGLGLARGLAEEENGEDQEDAYDRIMDWHADGFGFGEIMLAIMTSHLVGNDDTAGSLDHIDNLLTIKDRDGGWGKVWQNNDLIGRDRQDADANGEEERNGPPEGVPQGPPEGVPQGPPEDAPAGPPDHAQGPPDEVPAGPPEDAPAGPPEDISNGPPDHAQGPPEEVPVGPPDDVPTGPPNGAPAGPPGNGGGPAARSGR